MSKYLAVSDKVLFWLVPFLQFLMLEFSAGDYGVLLWLVPFNLIFYYFLFILMLFISKNKGITILLSTPTWYAIGIINNMVMQCRENPILPGDLLSLRTGLSVAANYDININTGICVSTAFFLVIMLVGILNIKNKIRLVPLKQVIFSVLSTIIFSLSVFIMQLPVLENYIPMHIITFELDTYYKDNGFCFSFVKILDKMKVKEPPNYDENRVKQKLNSYKTDYDNNEITPNIIVIMNEAYSDLSCFGEFKTNIPYNSYLQSLKQNNIVGSLYTSVRGGNTANTEYEFLTGNSMAFFAEGSIPYQQVIRDDTYSLVQVLKKNNYDTYAIHPYYKAGWNREKVYDHFGFDNKVFAEDISKNNLFDIFDETNLCRYYVSDNTLYNYIIKQYEERDKTKGYFNFSVTMQNHGGYSEDVANGFVPDVYVKGLENDYELSTYLSLIRKSDEAFKNLTHYFSLVSEPTIIIMFGDHQPDESVIDGLTRLINTNNGSAVSQYANAYEVPYIIWSNYDITVDAPEKISVNFLGEILLDAADINTNGYFAYLGDLKDKSPVITKNFFINNKIEFEFYNKDNRLFEEYEKLQYYMTNSTIY